MPRSRSSATAAWFRGPRRTSTTTSGSRARAGHRVPLPGAGRRPAVGRGRATRLERRAATLVRAGGRYDNRFRTFPPADAPVPVTFAVLGDYGVGIVDGRLDGARQLLLAGALERALDTMTCGWYHDRRQHLPRPPGHRRDGRRGRRVVLELLSAVPLRPQSRPVLPDRRKSRRRGQRELRRPRPAGRQPLPRARFRPAVETGSASSGPGLFYRFRVGADLEFICIDTSIASDMDVEHYFDDPAHSRWVKDVLEAPGGRWRIPFSHHPPFCAGPEHTNTAGMVDRLVPLFKAAGVRLVLSGHEHNFQHAVVDGIHYVVRGAAGKLRTEPPQGFAAAGTRAWAAAGHFLLVRADDAPRRPARRRRRRGRHARADRARRSGGARRRPRSRSARRR